MREPISIKLNCSGMKAFLGETSAFFVKNLYKSSPESQLIINDKPFDVRNVGLVKASNHHVKSSFDEIGKDEVVRKSLLYYLKKTGVCSKKAEIIFEIGMFVSYGLGEKEAVLIDLCSCSKDLSYEIAKMAFALFGGSNVLLIAPKLDSEADFAVVSSLEEIAPLKKEERIDFGKESSKSFDSFICDLAELYDEDEPSNNVNTFDESKIGNKLKYSSMSEKYYGEKAIVAQFNLDNRGEKEEGNIKNIAGDDNAKKIIFRLDEFNKTALSNLLFSIVFLGLSIATSFIYFSFSNNNNEAFFAICIIMVAAFFCMSLLPVSFQNSDASKNKGIAKKHPPFVIITSLVCIIISMLGFLSLFFIGKNSEWDVTKMWTFLGMFLGYPVLLVLFVTTLKIIGWVKRR